MPDVTRLHLAYRDRLERLRAATLIAIMQAQDATDAVPVVLDAQRDTVALTDAYMSLEAGLATGSDTEPWGIDSDRLIGVRARRGDFLEDVYGRNWATATTIGTFTERMAREVNTDITLADRATAFVHTEGDDRIAGTRRVLGAGPNCALCVVAATQRYRKADLRPIHRGCGCTTAAIYGDATTFRRPDKAALNDLYRRAGGTDFASLRRLTVNDADLPAGIDPAALRAVQVIDDDLGPTLVPA